MAESADVDVLARLSGDAASTVGKVRTDTERADRYHHLLGDPDRIVLVATDERSDRVIGVLAATEGDVGTLMPVPALIVEHLVVEAGSRKHGVGRALLTAVVRNADERAISQVVASVSMGNREANRYLARLGFSPLVLRRAASTAALHRSLSMPGHSDQADLRRRRGMRRVLSAGIVGESA